MEPEERDAIIAVMMQHLRWDRERCATWLDNLDAQLHSGIADDALAKAGVKTMHPARGEYDTFTLLEMLGAICCGGHRAADINRIVKALGRKGFGVLPIVLERWPQVMDRLADIYQQLNATPDGKP